MKDTIKDIIEFTISLAFNIHKITLVYVSVFKQLIERELSYDNG